MNNPYQDKLTNRIARYLTDGLNDYLTRYNREAKVTGDKWDVAVVAYRDYDAFDVGLEQFPLLKVFRVAESFTPRTTKATTTLRITYCLAYPQLEQLASLMKWAALTINELLLEADKSLNIIDPPGGAYRADYNTFMGQNGQPVYAFLSFTANFIE